MTDQKKPRRMRGAGSVFRKGNNHTWTIQYYREGYRRDTAGNLIVDGAGRPVPARVRVRESTGFTQQRRAQDLLTERLSQVAKGEYTEPQRHPVTVEALLNALGDHNRARAKDGDNSLRRRRRHLDPFFAGVVAARVTTDLVTRYTLRRQGERAANATINRELAALRRAFNLGKRATPPKLREVPHIELLPENNVRKGFVEHADFVKLTEAAGELWLRAFLELGYTYGWRKGELLKLRARNVNLLTRKIRLDVGTTKNKQGREVMMTATVAELLRACLAGKKPDDYVLTRGRKPKRVCDVRDAWQALCARAGLGTFVCAKCGCAELKKNKCAECGSGKRKYRGLIPHDLRRSAVKAGRRAGVSEDALMKMGGWKTRAMISRYSIESESDQQATVAALEAQRAREANSPRSAPFTTETPAPEQPRAEVKVQ